MRFRDVATYTKPEHQIMDSVEGYLNKIAASTINDGNAYLLLTYKMINIVANNTTLTNTVAMMQTEKRMICNKTKSIENKLVS